MKKRNCKKSYKRSKKQKYKREYQPEFLIKVKLLNYKGRNWDIYGLKE